MDRYEARIDMSVDNAHTRVIRLVGEGKRVLELGCATGYMSRVLSERFGCTVVGVEMDPEAAEKARPACRRVIVGDLDALDLAAELGDERFDVVVCGDVLEHLRDPGRTLAAVRPVLAPGGYVVASIPNIAHVSVIAELLQGRFPYGPHGLLDGTHLRFYTRESIYRCFEEAGFVVSHLERVRVEPDQTEFHTDLARLPAELAALLRAHEESTTYQFVLKAEAAAEGRGVETLQGAVEATTETWPPAASPAAETRRDRLDALLEALWHRMAFLEDERRHQALNLQEQRRQIEGLTAERDHWRRMADIQGQDRDNWRRQAEALDAERDRWRGEAEVAGREAQTAKETLAAIYGSTAWSLLDRYRKVRLALIPRDSRRERVYTLGLRAAHRLAASRRVSPLGVGRRLAFRVRRARDLGRIAYTVYATQGATELGRKTVAYLRRIGQPGASLQPDDLPSPVELRAWFVRRRRPVAIVIPTYKQTKLVSDCVQSILAALSPDARALVRIVVVDDGSSSDVQEYLRGLPVDSILRSENEGFARTVNAGLAATEGEDVVILNNDTVAHPGWLEALQYCAYAEPSIGIVGAKLLYPDGRIQSAGSYRSVTAPEWFDHCYRFTPADHPPANVQREVLAVTGACMYVKRAVLDAIGPLDPQFAMAYEDVDYCLRAREAGFGILYCPHATLTHLEGYTRGERKEAREIRSQEYFWEKWGRHFEGRRVWTGSPRALDIIYVLQDTGIAGGHRVVFEHLNRLRARGHDVRLYSLAAEPKWFPLRAPVMTFPDYEALGVDLSRQPAIKVATWWETAERVWKGSLRTGIPVYLVQDIETSYYHHDPRTQRQRAQVLASYRKEFHYLTDATWTQKQLEGQGLSATVVPPGIDHEIFRPLGLPRRPDVLLSLGRSHPLKNVGLLLSAYERMAPRPALHLFGVEREVGKRQMARYVFNPSDREAAQLYNTATAFVLTSVHEGYGLPILEAWACGCPVVCTDADGNMDFCRDGENCLIVAKDDPGGLAATLERLLGDPALQEHLRAGGLATVAQYTWERAIGLVEDFYATIARDRSRRA